MDSVRSVRAVFILVVAGLGAVAWPGIAVAPASDATAPAGRPPVGEGQAGRLTLGGTWSFRGPGAEHWTHVSLPHDWNARETRTNRAGVGHYRRDFVLPHHARSTRWVIRFEGVGHDATARLNGRVIARHEGDYTPFEAVLRGVRSGANRLEVTVSSLRSRSDLTHWRPARAGGKGYGNGMWWNFGGIHREVSLRPVRGLDVERSQALTRLSCRTCPATVEVHTVVRNLGATPRAVALTLAADGRTHRTPRSAVPAGAEREIVSSFSIAHPRLWEVGHGELYALRVSADAGPGSHGTYRTHFGVRDLRKTADGRVLLNGRPLRVRGVSAHEDSPVVGSAWRAPQRAELLRRIDDLHATVVRAHYPLHPATMEALDRRGVLVWEQAPVNQVQNDQLARPAVRARAVQAVQETVMRDRGHPSVLAFSIANELPVPVTQGQIDYVRAAAAAVRRLDPTRLVAVDRVARYGAPDDGHPVWGAVDAIGANEYFGWYRGAFRPRPPATTADLAAYLDTLHRKQPHAALFLTEFGAEANRRGPAREKGTYAFQARYLRDQLRVAIAHPFVSGAMVWNLRDFRVYPGWNGGNPKPDPPYNTKGLIGTDGRLKPAYRTVRAIFRAR